VLSSELSGNQWSAPLTGCLTYGTHCVGVWIGLRASLDTVAKKKSCLCQKKCLSRPARRLDTILTELFQPYPEHQPTSISSLLLSHDSEIC
jgi:hypothetical protein